MSAVPLLKMKSCLRPSGVLSVMTPNFSNAFHLFFVRVTLSYWHSTRLSVSWSSESSSSSSSSELSGSSSSSSAPKSSSSPSSVCHPHSRQNIGAPGARTCATSIHSPSSRLRLAGADPAPSSCSTRLRHNPPAPPQREPSSPIESSTST
jgi:hypothetical protein